MGFIFDPNRKAEAQIRLGALMRDVSRKLSGGVAFAMEPVVYDFSINERGTFAELDSGSAATLPDGYYNIVLPAMLRRTSSRSQPASDRTWSASVISAETFRVRSAEPEAFWSGFCRTAIKARNTAIR